MRKIDERRTIWVMDTDLCDECGGLVDDFGICLDCGSDGIEWDAYDNDDWEDYDDD